MARHTRLETLLATLRQGVVPLFHEADPATARSVLRAVRDGGAQVVEFTNRGDGAHEVFAELARSCRDDDPDIVLGAGSVLDAGTAALYLDLGASFVVSPVLSAEIAAVCNRRQVAYLPGCATAAEISRAHELGAEIVKVFPAEAAGGPDLVKSVLGPMPWSRLMPTGGVRSTRDSLSAWFDAGAACVGLGSDLLRPDDIRAGRWDEIAERVREVRDLVAECRPRPEEEWA